MKQIISSKLYDTDTATKLASTYLQSPSGVEVGLYRKTNGEYFTAFTDYAIYPLTDAEAKDWVGKWAVDSYTALFGQVSE